MSMSRLQRDFFGAMADPAILRTMLESAVQRALGHAAFAGQLGGREERVSPLSKSAYHLRDPAPRHFAVIAAGDAHEADDPTIRSAQGHFGRDEPTKVVLFVEPDL